MIKKIFDLIESAEKILIITHVNPDGDTLGCACAMKSYIGEKADILVQVSKGKSYPEIYSFLSYLKKAKTLDNVENIYDTDICLDIASVDRIVENAREIFNKARVTINIDHHKTNKGYAAYNHILGSLSSTGEVIYEMFSISGKKITLEMAECLYVSILTDTGCFKYETVTPRTLQIAAELAEIGVNTADIASKCYDLKPKTMVMFQSYCTSNAKFECDDKIVYTLISKETMGKFSAKDEYTEGICELLRSIKSVEFAFVLKETSDNSTKVSMRSKQKDATLIAKKFGGGGHTRSAGCTIKKSLNQSILCLLDEVRKYI